MQVQSLKIMLLHIAWIDMKKACHFYIPLPLQQTLTKNSTREPSLVML